MTPPCSHRERRALRFELGAMLAEMFSAPNHFEVLQPVVKLVAADVVSWPACTAWKAAQS